MADATPDPRPSAWVRLLPWATEVGAGPRLARGWWKRCPGVAVYLASTVFLFGVYLALERHPPAWLVDLFVYEIPELGRDPWLPLQLVTAVWVNANPDQLVYVVILLALFGVAFEVREGTLRTAGVFYAGSIAAGIFAGALLHVIQSRWDAAWIDKAWRDDWTGGSAGCFALMGGVAARAENPWGLLTLILAWELSVEFWYLRNYTPVFHLTALVVGFALTRWALPRRA